MEAIAQMIESLRGIIAAEYLNTVDEQPQVARHLLDASTELVGAYDAIRSAIMERDDLSVSELKSL